MSIHRCDVAKSGRQVCAGWGETTTERGKGRLVLD
jgi:hypothetical protein